MTLGKLPAALLSRYLLSMTGAPSDDLVVPPSIGLDFGAVRVGGGYLLVSSDPVTGISERVGYHAVNVSANDVATSGNRPRFMQSVILLPERAKTAKVARIAAEMNRAAKELGITIVGGHTELTPGLGRPIVVTTAFAHARSFITAAGAKEGDSLILTKGAGIEGTAILGGDASLFGDEDIRRRARVLFAELSIVDEAVSAYQTGEVHAMHDCTEGGVIGAMYEMAVAARLGFDVAERSIRIAGVTREVCESLRIDPLKLISSGSLLLAVTKGSEKSVIRAVEGAGSNGEVIGRFTSGKRVLRRPGGATEVKTAPLDELWKLAARRARRRKPG